MADWIEKAGSWIDRGISLFAPHTALRRQAARRAGKILAVGGSYRGSRSTRLNANWSTRIESADASIYGELETLRNRARDLNRNDAVASGATDTITVNVIKNGLAPQSRIRSKILGLNEERTAAFQDSAEAVYEKWSPFADAAGKLDFAEIQSLAIRQIIESGEFLAVRRMIERPGSPYLLALDVIEPDRLGFPTTAMTATSRFGIELDDYGAPKNYRIAKTHPGDISGGGKWEIADVQAKDSSGRQLVFHLFPLKRPGQTRGVPFFAPVIEYFKTLADYIEAELVAARIAACFAVFIKTASDPYIAAAGRSSGTQTDQAGNSQQIETLEPGIIDYLRVGEEAQFANPQRPGTTFDAFVERLLRLIGTALGLPYEFILKDFSKTNYSSARAALIQAYRFFQVWQEFIRKHLCQPIWEILLEEAWLRGEIVAPGFLERKFEYTRASWVMPGWPYVNPLDEVNASEKAIKMGIKSRAQVCAEQGDDWEETAEQISREKKKFDELGLPWEGVDAKAKETQAAQKQEGPGNPVP